MLEHVYIAAANISLSLGLQTGTGRTKETHTCFVCGKLSHLAQDCQSRKVAATSKTDVLKVQIEELTKQLAVLKGTKEEEGF